MFALASLTAKLTTEPDVNAELAVLLVEVEALLAAGLLLVEADEVAAEYAGLATEAVLTGLAAELAATLVLTVEATDCTGALDTALLGVVEEAALDEACETEFELSEATLETADDEATLLLAELTAVVLLAEVVA